MVEYTSPLPTAQQSAEYQSPLPQRSEPRVQNYERSRYTLPVLLGITPEEVDQAAAQGQLPRLQQEAQQQATANTWTRMERRIDQSFEEGLSTEEAVVRLAEYYSQNPFIGSLVDPSLVSQVMSSDNDLARQSMYDRLRKVSILNDITQEIVTQQGERSWPKAILDFVDTMVAVPIDTNLATEGRLRTAAELTQLLSSNLTDEEFSTRARDLITEVADQGWLTEVNNNYVMQMLDVLPEGGQGIDPLEQRLWSVFDTATIVAPIVANTLRPALKGGRGMAMALGDVAGDPVSLLARTGADAEDIAPALAEAARVDSPTSGVNPVNREVGVLTPANRRPTVLSAPEHQAMRNLEEVTPYLQSVLRQNAGQAIDDNLLLALRDERIRLSAENGRREVIDVDVWADDLENVFVTEWLGTKTGADFRRIQNATQAARRVGGTVEQVGENAYRVRLESPVPLAPNGVLSLDDLKLWQETNIDELGTGVFARWGSPLAQTDQRLNALLKQTESGRHMIINKLNQEIAAMKKKVGRKNVSGVEKVYKDLQSGSLAGRRTDLSPDEFRQQFRIQNGRDATPQEVEYYDTLVNFNVTSWAVDADLRYKDAANRGLTVLNIDETPNVVKRMDEVSPEEMVWDLDNKELVPADRLTKANIFSMAGDFFKTADGKNVQYVATRKPNTRRLYHSDVMPYNPGGPRINVGAKFFVKQEYEIEVPTKTGTKTVSGTPKTAMAVRLEEESVAAVRQLNNIVDWVNAKLGTVPKTLDETYEALRGFAEDADFRRLLDENSEWNIHIQTMDDLIEFFSENMLDPRKKFNVANDGGPIGDLTKTYLPGIDPAMSFGDSYRVMAPRRLGRRDKPLIEYGGDPIRTVGSIESLEKSVLRNAAKKTEMTYLSAAVNGLVKSIIVVEKRAAKGLDNHVLRNAKDLSSLQGLTLKAKLSRLTEMIDTSTVKGQKLMLEADKILWRMNQEVPTQRAWNAVKNYIGDWAYKKVNRGYVTVDPNPPVQEGFTRVYRFSGDDNKPLAKVADWIAESDDYKQMVNAKGRWFSDDIEEARWYKKEHPEGSLKYVDIPTKDLESYRVSNIVSNAVEDPKKFSARPDKELFLPKEFLKNVKDYKEPTREIRRSEGWTKALNWADRYSTDPIQVAQGYVFDMVLGAFAWDQFLVQSSQIFNTVALSPIHGTKSAALYGPARYLLMNGRPEVMAQWGRWLQPVTGLTPEQFTEALLMIKQDGRLITNLSVAELGEDIAWTGGFNKAREAGRVFFNEGELVARITAHMTAYMEWTAKNAGPATSQEGRRWISLRQDKLTQAMTYASRSPFQNVPMTQFLSYTWRMTEQLFAGSLGGKAVLSGAEKARLVGAHVLLFGAAGVPAAGWVADRVYYRYGVDVPEESWSLLRYGMLDVALGAMLGEGTAMSSRLA